MPTTIFSVFVLSLADILVLARMDFVLLESKFFEHQNNERDGRRFQLYTQM